MKFLKSGWQHGKGKHDVWSFCRKSQEKQWQRDQRRQRRQPSPKHPHHHDCDPALVHPMNPNVVWSPCSPIGRTVPCQFVEHISLPRPRPMRCPGQFWHRPSPLADTFGQASRNPCVVYPYFWFRESLHRSFFSGCLKRQIVRECPLNRRCQRQKKHGRCRHAQACQSSLEKRKPTAI